MPAIRRMVALAALVTTMLGGLAVPAGADAAADQATFVADINATRAAAGVAPLTVDPRLVTLAVWWAGKMAAAGGISHNPNLAAMGPPGWTVLGENVGVGPSAASLNAAFDASPPHLANIVDPRFNAIGVGVVSSGGVEYVTEDFMAGPSQPATPPAPRSVSSAGAPAGTTYRSVAPITSGAGFWTAGSNGSVVTHGAATFLGSPATLNHPVVGMAATPSGAGYWLTGSDGGVFSFGNAGFHGSTGAMVLNRPIVGMAPTSTGQGYWLVASDGGIFSFGDATFHGSTGAMRLNRPIVGMASTPSGHGYWLVASDGGIFSFGDATFHGSTGAMTLNQPIVSMAGDGAGGYWLLEADGTVHAFGSAAQ